MSERLSRHDKPGTPAATGPVLRGPGRPLDSVTRASMEAGFGQGAVRGRTGSGPAAEADADRVAASATHASVGSPAAATFDFRAVRIHDGEDAAESARAQRAAAYAVGDHIVFGAGRFQPGTPAGRNLLAHELAHTIQQKEAGTERVQKKDENEPLTSTTETAASVFPYPKDAKVRLSALFPDAMFGFGANSISTWVHSVQDQQLTVTEGTADRFVARFDGVVQRTGPGAAAGGPGLPNVRIAVERVGPGRFQITIFSDAKVLAAQEARATRSAQGTTVLTPVAPKPVPLPSAAKPPSKADEYAKSGSAPLPGLETPSKPDQDKAVADSLMKPPPPETVPAAPTTPAATTPAAGAAPPAPAMSKEDEETLKKAGENVSSAFFKLPEGKRLTDAASKAAEKLPTVVMVVVPATLLATAFVGLAATKSESPIKESPDIPLGKIGSVEMKAKVTFKGPANKPTEASITLTFAKGSLEVAPAFKRTWIDAKQPPGTGVEFGLSAKIPLGPEPAKVAEPTDTEKTKAEVERLREEEAAFKKGLKFKPGSAEAKAEEMEKRAADAVAKQPFQPGLSGPVTSPRILQAFDPRPGPGKTPWNLDRLSKMVAAAFASTPGATLHVVVTYAVVPGDTEQARNINNATRDTAASDAADIKRALEEWMPPTKGRIQTSIEFKHGGRTFGLSSEDLERLSARGAAVILIPGPTSK